MPAAYRTPTQFFAARKPLPKSCKRCQRLYSTLTGKNRNGPLTVTCRQCRNQRRGLDFADWDTGEIAPVCGACRLTGSSTSCLPVPPPEKITPNFFR
jgi:hypothetical protein